MLTICSLAAYEAEHPTNTGFATIGDAFWWGLVTLTTVGYGDIVPKTFAGRAAGVALMFTGVAVLGVLAGSMAELFHLDKSAEKKPAAAGTPSTLAQELSALQEELAAVNRRLGALSERAAAEPSWAEPEPLRFAAADDGNHLVGNRRQPPGDLAKERR